MGNLKSLALLALLVSLSLAVFADTSTDATHAKDDVKPSTEATDAIEPQQRGGCRYGCCGSYAFGRCSACCSRPQTTEVEVEASDVDLVSQQGWGWGRGGGGGPGGWGGGGPGGWGGGCRFGCCGGGWGGRCRYCCSLSQALEAEATEAKVVDPQQGGGGGRAGGGGGRGWGGGGCRYGCCGGWWRGRCRYCCTSQAEANEVVQNVVPEQKKATEGEKKKEEAKP